MNVGCSLVLLVSEVGKNTMQIKGKSSETVRSGSSAILLRENPRGEGSHQKRMDGVLASHLLCPMPPKKQGEKGGNLNPTERTPPQLCRSSETRGNVYISSFNSSIPNVSESRSKEGS